MKKEIKGFKLLTRTEFREGVLSRSDHKCVVCASPAVDAHHIVERRLWTDEGYYLDNGAAVCEACHRKCETTEISLEQIRAYAGVRKIQPDHFYDDTGFSYDKWGNIILPNGTRLKGELFYDESVQKILKQGDVLRLFGKYVKYPRTMHLPWSEGRTADDRILKTTDHLKACDEIVVTLKYDGENSTLYNDYVHARSLQNEGHPSRDWLKGWHASIRNDIPDGWRICAENLFAKHSILYSDLENYVLGFSLWNEYNICMSWDDTLMYFELMGITPVQTLYRGPYDENILKEIAKNLDTEKNEGYVVRPARAFPFAEFRNVVGKYVRKNHVHTHGHWMREGVVKNKLASDVSKESL